MGLAPDRATVTDNLQTGGLTLGVSAQLRRGQDWPLTLRFGAGVFLGSVRDARSGTGTDLQSSPQLPFAIDTQQSQNATYLYLAPEARLGRRFGDHFELWERRCW
jgi:hypothetical protein